MCDVMIESFLITARTIDAKYMLRFVIFSCFLLFARRRNSSLTKKQNAKERLFDSNYLRFMKPSAIATSIGLCR